MKKRNLLAVVAIVLMVSCTENEVPVEGNNANSIKFTSVIDNNELRAATTYGVINLTALRNSVDGFAVSTAGLGTGNEMNNLQVIYNLGLTAWAYTGNYYWPLNSSQNVSFTSYAPAGTANVTLSGTGLTATNFIPAATVGSQIDLLYAPPANFNRIGSGVSGVALTFKHILTQVVFAVSTDIAAADNPKIESIVLTVPQNRGNYDGTNWTPSSSNQTYTLFNSTPISSTAVTSTPLLLIPQTIPAGTTAAVTFSINGVSSSSTVDLSTLTIVKTWQQGSKVTYNISFNNSDLKIKFTDPTITQWTNANDGIIY